VQPTVETLRNALVARGKRPTEFTVSKSPAAWQTMLDVQAETNNVQEWFRTYETLAQELDLEVYLSLAEKEPLEGLLRRLIDDLRRESARTSSQA
jgi:hypothetical protein